MAWNKKEEVSEEKAPLYTDADYRRFKEAMRPFKGNKLINGVLASPFEQYLHELRTITVSDTHSRFVVHDPEGFTKMNAMNTRYENHEYHLTEEGMKRNPQERIDLQKRIAQMGAKFKV